MKRTFWLGAGLAAGATGAVMASRWAKKQAQRMTPTHIAKEMQGDVVDLSKRLADSIAAGKAAMEDREREIRTQIDDETSGSARLD